MRNGAPTGPQRDDDGRTTVPLQARNGSNWDVGFTTEITEHAERMEGSNEACREWMSRTKDRGGNRNRASRGGLVVVELEDHDSDYQMDMVTVTGLWDGIGACPKFGHRRANAFG
jgi:hypothetical protein